MSFVQASPPSRRRGRGESPPRQEARRRSYDELAAGTQALIAEFADRLAAGTVIRQVARAREELLAAGVRAGLPIAAVTMARQRLSAFIPAHAGQSAPSRT